MSLARICVMASTPTTPKPLVPFPLPPPLSPPHGRQRQQCLPDAQSLIRRRDAGVLLSIVAFILPAPVSAFSFGISGPKNWLREQKKKSSKFILAPIDASRNSLQTAYLLLRSKDADFEEKELEEFQKLLRSSARDCVPQERNSFVSFQATTGVEVCTFSLVVKNASSLLADKDPTKLEAEAKLVDLIKYFH